MEQKIFSTLKKIIGLRKETAAFADFDNRQLLAVDNPHLFVFARTDPYHSRSKVLVVGNFSDQPQPLKLEELRAAGFFQQGPMRDLYVNERVPVVDDALVVQPLSFYWLTD